MSSSWIANGRPSAVDTTLDRWTLVSKRCASKLDKLHTGPSCVEREERPLLVVGSIRCESLVYFTSMQAHTDGHPRSDADQKPRIYTN
jgi:hypothetical protein